MKALLGKGWLIGLIVVILLALLMWFGGPYVSFGSVQPFASLTGRLIGLIVLIVCWAVWVQISAWRAQRRGAALVGSVAAGNNEGAAQSRAPDSQSPAEAAGLQDRFNRAIAALRKTGRARNLYDLPWYVIIGAPGSGKTTALLNASLNFPLEKEFGRDPLKGVGGTRNCDWWITDSAILLDTAGRYTTQDSDANADRGGWQAFLGLLRKHRRRRPINGVLLALSIADLVAQDEHERERHVRAIRQRLDELHRELKISFPVYVLFTKVDLLAGFNEHFDDLNLAGRAQVWGMTFPVEASQAGNAAAGFGGEFDLLAARLQERLVARLADERDLGRRAAAFAFQGQFAGIKPLLLQTIDGIFRGADHAGQAWLRGCYFTSGTQEGTPIDRMLGALSRTFGLNARAQVAASGGGKSYFLDHLLKNVVFEEAGLAGVNRARELREAALSIAAYALIGLITVLGIVGLVTSYRANSNYITQVQSLTSQLLAGQAQGDAASGRIETALPRLDALRLVVDAAKQHNENRPLSMGFGLYQGRSISNAAEDGYHRALNATLGPWAGEHFATQLRNAAAEPDRIYEYLRAYLMLSEPKRLEPAQLEQIAGPEWVQRFPGDAATAQSVASHFQAWVSDPTRIASIPADDTLVRQARTSLAQASVPLLMYSRMRLAYAGQKEGQIRLDHELSLGADSLFVRRSGAPLSQPLSALYTRAAFDEFNRAGKVALLQQFLDDGWVLGDQAPKITESPRLVTDVTALYEQDYIRAWDAVIGDLALRPIRDDRDALGVLESLTSATSPLKNLLVLVEKQTNLTKPPATPAAANPAQGATAMLSAQIDRALGSANAAKPGTLVAAHFEPLHKLVDGPPGGAPIDSLLAQLKQPLQQLRGAAGGAGGAAAVAQALDMMKVVAGQLPAPASSVVGQAVAQSGGFALGQARTELGNRYNTQVVANCQDLVGNRYPFDRNATADVAIADFGRVFAPSGVFDSFFQGQLAQFVDTSTATWRWKEETRDIAAVPLRPFQDAERIRLAFFGPGGGAPSMPFTIEPDSLDADVDRFVLTLDGQTLEYSHGQRKALKINWPSATPSGASYVFEEKGGARPNRSFAGPWAAFRLIESGKLEKQSDTRFILTLSGGKSSVRLVLTMDSVRNPLARPELLRFRCGG
jgi:type VI secretion system protein ImpL